MTSVDIHHGTTPRPRADKTVIGDPIAVFVRSHRRTPTLRTCRALVARQRVKSRAARLEAARTMPVWAARIHRGILASSIPSACLAFGYLIGTTYGR